MFIVRCITSNSLREPTGFCFTITISRRVYHIKRYSKTSRTHIRNKPATTATPHCHLIFVFFLFDFLSFFYLFSLIFSFINFKWHIKNMKSSTNLLPSMLLQRTHKNVFVLKYPYEQSSYTHSQYEHLFSFHAKE